jgi:L,D-peptidoglycan transpeptidase YkuD (ErfK/YbiS/YcfS/YnhG family)
MGAAGATAALFAAFLAGTAGARAAPPQSHTGAEQLIVVSSPTAKPPGSIASLRTYQRDRPRASWRPVAGPWPAEIGRSGFESGTERREGDGSTPTGIFPIGQTLYGNDPEPHGIQLSYVKLACGDWWDEDPASPRYNRFVALPCGVTPWFAARSEALWTETVAYPYFAVIGFNTDPVRAGPGAFGSGIFLHAWIGAPTQGCVALHSSELLDLLRWLRPDAQPTIEITVGR